MPRLRCYFADAKSLCPAATWTLPATFRSSTLCSNGMRDYRMDRSGGLPLIQRLGIVAEAGRKSGPLRKLLVSRGWKAPGSI